MLKFALLHSYPRFFSDTNLSCGGRQLRNCLAPAPLPSPWLLRPVLSPRVPAAVYLPLTVLMSLALLQPVKGAVVGLQWALRMQGFNDNAPDRVPPSGELLHDL